MYKKDLALNDQQWLICHKTKPSQTKIPLYNIKTECALGTVLKNI